MRATLRVLTSNPLGMLTEKVADWPKLRILGGEAIVGLALDIHGGFKNSTRYSVAYFLVVTLRFGLLPAIIMFPLGVKAVVEWYNLAIELVGIWELVNLDPDAAEGS